MGLVTMFLPDPIEMKLDAITTQIGSLEASLDQ
jgi:hypothetical protein